jgi:formylglycine-generating enzyme required for sulfatase activity
MNSALRQFILLAIGIMLAACNGLTVFVNNPKMNFSGIETAQVSEDGYYHLNWQSVSKENRYKVYVKSSDLPPNGYSLFETVKSDQDSFLNLRKGSLNQEDIVSNFEYLSTVKDSTYEYRVAIDPNKFYVFAVVPEDNYSNVKTKLIVSKTNLSAVLTPTINTSDKAGISRLTWIAVDGALTYALYIDDKADKPIISSNLTSVDFASYLERYPGLCIRSQRGALVSDCQSVKSSGLNAVIQEVTSKTANGYYKSSDEIYLELLYSNAINVTGIPALPLNNGKFAQYISGSGSNRLLFVYRVEPGDDIPFLEVRNGQDLTMTGANIFAIGKANVTLPLVSDGATLEGRTLLTIDTTPPTAPSSVAFPLTLTRSTRLDFAWLGSTDANFKRYNVKLCAANDCSSSCSISTSTADLNFSATGVNGSSYYACVEAEDKAAQKSAWVASALPISVDTSAPVVSRVQSLTADGYYKAGDVLNLKVVFSEPVFLTGTSELALSLLVSNRKAQYVSGSGSNELLYTYTIAAGDTSADLDVESSSALTLGAGGSLQDAAGNDASRSLNTGAQANSLKTLSAVVVDTTLPLPPSNVRFNNAVSGTVSLPLFWNVGFDSNFKQYNSKICAASDCLTSCTSSVSSVTLSASAIGVDGSTYYACVQTQDRVDQLSAWVPSAGTVTVDLTMAGVLRVESPTPNALYKNGDLLDFDIVFSKNVTVTNGPDIKLFLDVGNPTHAASYISGSGTNTLRFRYAAVLGDNSEDLTYIDSNSLSLGSTGAIKDAGNVSAILTLPATGSGNALDDLKAIQIDTLAPTAPSAVLFASAYSTSAAVPFSWTESTDLHFRYHNLKLCTQSNCSTGCTSVVTAVNSPSTVTGVNGSSYYACVQGEDIKGFQSAWVGSSSSITIDTTPPSISVVDSSNISAIYDVGQTLSINLNLSEIVNVANPSDVRLALEVGSGSAQALYDSGSGSNKLVFKYTVAAGDASQDLELKSTSALSLGATGSIKDLAGLDLNLSVPVSGVNALSTGKTIILDTLPPTPASSVGFSAANTNSTTFNVLWSNSSDPNFDTHNVKVCEANDCSTACSTVVTSTSTPAAQSGVDGKTYYGCVQGKDLAGHLTAYIPSITTIRVDTTPPSVIDVTSATVGNLFKIDDVILVKVKFSENVVVGGGTNVNLRIANGASGTLASYMGGSGSDTLTFAYTVAQGDVSSDLEVFNDSSLALAGGTTVQDIVGNNGILTLPALGGTASLSGHRDIAIDGIRPSVPSAVVFTDPSEMLNPAREVQWSPSSDTSFDHHNVKLCEANNCSSACVGGATSVASPKTVTGTAGKTYYACVQGQDVAGNTSAWVPSAGTISIDPSPTFTGVTEVDVLGSLPNGNANIQVKFGAPPTGHITHYKVYYSSTASMSGVDLNSPIATIARGDAISDAVPTDDRIALSFPAADVEDGYYLVRYMDQGNYFPDSNTVLTRLLVLKGTAGFKLVPKKFSGLSYDYFMMKYEATLSAGSNPGGDSVTKDETNLAICEAKFHTAGAASDSTCGTKNIGASAMSLAGVIPKHSISWNSAFFACRNASSANALVRLPTYEEWVRASRKILPDYSSTITYVNNGSADSSACNDNNTGYRVTGGSSNCFSSLKLYDMVGNLSEWVDYRLKATSVTRFGSTQNIGTVIRNGIDNITMQWPQASPGSINLALSMGSYLGSASTGHIGPAQLGLFDTTSTGGTGIGFRCMGFRADSVPALADMALVDQPKFTASDLTESVATRRVPENSFVGSDKPERVKINLSGNLADSIAEGDIEITWTPWNKTVCNVAGSCTSSDSGITYKLYRFLSPNLFSQKEGTMRWALGIAGSVYTTDTLLDPIGIDSSWNPSFTAATANGKLIATVSNCTNATPANCAFTDSSAAANGFSPNSIYEYVLVAGEGATNYRYADVPRFRPVTMLGLFSNVYNAGTSRLEPRFRRASVFPIDAAYQLAQTVPQVMVHVPLDQSGLDRDIFMQKYEGSVASGSYHGGGGGAPNLPNQPGVCIDAINRTNTIPWQSCGIAGYNNVTTTILQSRPGRAPAADHDWGDAFRACLNSGLIEGSGKAYRHHLPSSAEWFKAADWGDVDFDGIIDQNPFTGSISIASLQSSSSPDTTTVRCHVDASPASAYSTGSTSTATCVSRYGAENMVGNLAEWIADRSSNKTAQDNGTDGIGMGQPFLTTSGNISNLSYNLMSAFPTFGGAIAYADFDAYTSPADNNIRNISRGGSYDASAHGAAGRFNMDTRTGNYDGAGAIQLGFRCAN